MPDVEVSTELQPQRETPGDRTVSTEDVILAEIKNPAVEALARILLRKGIIDLDEWRKEMRAAGSDNPFI